MGTAVWDRSGSDGTVTGVWRAQAFDIEPIGKSAERLISTLALPYAEFYKELGLPNSVICSIATGILEWWRIQSQSHAEAQTIIKVPVIVISCAKA
jgi:hypothetical protein